ncbi:MAG TPA: hypothetical protein VKS78_01030 [Roseiarcus sp.]|nr:hypothetical protein [Roseiarcus sp.]
MEIAEEGEAAGTERTDPNFSLLSGRDHLLDGRRMHFEFIGRVVGVGDDDEERLAGRACGPFSSRAVSPSANERLTRRTQ